MKMLRIWIEELQGRVEYFRQGYERKCAEKDAVVQQARDWKARTRILARDRDALREDRNRLEEELHKLRQARAAERAQPTEGEARTVLDDVRRVLDPPELVGTVQAVRDLVAELAATKEKLDRLDERNDALRDENERLKAEESEVLDALPPDIIQMAWAEDAPLSSRVGELAAQYYRLQEISERKGNEIEGLKKDLEMRDNDVQELRNELQCNKRTLDSVLKREDVLRRGRDRLEEQAEGYRRTIAGLRLPRPSSPLDTPASVSAWADTVGPDRITDPNHVDEGGEAVNRGGM